MTPPGPPPKPSALKKLAGNPGKRRINKKEPRPPQVPGLGDPPDWLDKESKAEWRRIAPHLLTLGLLTVVDRAALEAYCKAYSRWRQAEAIIEKSPTMMFKTQSGYVQQLPHIAVALRYMAQMHALAGQFGFTPASRSRIHTDGEGDIPPAGGTSDLDSFVSSKHRHGRHKQPGAQEEDASSRTLH